MSAPTLSDPDDLMASGKYMGYSYEVVANRHFGTLNGYIKLFTRHPWNRHLKYTDETGGDLDRVSIPVIIHGGITFIGRDANTSNYWLGIDFAHGFDGNDLSLIKDPIFKEIVRGFDNFSTKQSKKHVWKTKEVEKELFCLIEQAALASGKPLQSFLNHKWTDKRSEEQYRAIIGKEINL